MRTLPVAKPAWLDRLRIAGKPLRCPCCNGAFPGTAVYPGAESLYYCSIMCATTSQADVQTRNAARQ